MSDTLDFSGTMSMVKTDNGWQEARQRLARAPDIGAMMIAIIFNLVSVLDSPSNVTLLGDAIHAMTPTRVRPCLHKKRIPSPRRECVSGCDCRAGA